MSIYHYNGASVIDEITFRKTANGSVRAYLHAREGIDAAAAQVIKDSIERAGFEWLSFTLNGKSVLEVRGFQKDGPVNEVKDWLFGKRKDPLLELLSQNNFIQGNATVTKEPSDVISWKELFRKNTMFLSGLIMTGGDAGFAYYGFKEAKIHKLINPKHRRDFSEMLAGFAYVGGSVVLGLYGRNDQSDLQVREMAELILQKGRERGLIADNSAAASLGSPRKESVFTKVDNFFREHPAEVGNMLYFAAGALIAQAAVRHRLLKPPRKDMSKQQIHELRKGGWTELGLGTSTMLSGLLATFGREKAHDPDDPQKHGLGATVEWIKSNPLAIASYGYIGSTLFHAWTTYNDRKEARRASKDMNLSANERFLATEKTKSIPWRVLFIGASLVGEFLLSISSKGHGEGVVSDTSVDESAIAVAADLVAKQPKATQDSLIDYMGGFLGGQDMLAIGHEEATKKLRAQVEAMRGSPWAQPSGNVKTVVPAAQEAQMPAWQAKLAAQEAGATPLHLAV